MEPELHAVMVTIPLRGHVYPLLHFAKALVAAHPHATVTFVNNGFFHSHVLAREVALSSCTIAAGGKLRFESVEDGLPSDFDFDDVWPRQEEFLQGCISMRDSLQALMESLRRKHPPVSCLVFGSFFYWGHSVAMNLGIPSVFFWSQSAAVFSIYRHIPLLADSGFFHYETASRENQEDNEQLVSCIPGIKGLYPEEFPTFLHKWDKNAEALKRIEWQFDVLKDCKAVVVNSFYELEKEVLDALQAEVPIFAVGPLLSLKQTSGSSNDDVTLSSIVLENEINECLKWLNTQRSHSVLYISFGTLSNPPPEHIKVVAVALKESKQPFIWSIRGRSSHSPSCSIVRQHSSFAETLPEHFLDDTSEYGMIVPWAPQQEVLDHPSVGAFLTHCGWNSTLEGLSMGVPMITLPSFSDQPTNAKYIVDVWKVGMKLTVDKAGNIDSADLVSALKTVFCTEQGPELRKRAGQLREAARRALAISSKKEMSKFCSILMPLSS